MNDSRVIVALDYPSANQALAFVDRVRPEMCGLKVGKELFVASGPQLIDRLIMRDFKVFLDLKFHDIPNTVANACRAAANLGVWMMNVHASGGPKMMRAAVAALSDIPKERRPLIIGVTVLTSMDQDQLSAVGIDRAANVQVANLSKLAEDCGLDGVVCSALEVAALRTMRKPEFLLVTPGIRPAGSDAGDQVRIATPAGAVMAGSDYLVIGRPITEAPDPVAALEAINAEVQEALAALSN